MAELNQDEQTRVDRYNELQAAYEQGSKRVDKAQLASARQSAEYAERNAEARERFKAQRDVERKAESDRLQARRDTEVTAAQDAYKRVARVTFPRTDAQFADAWPALLQAWQIRNTSDGMDALIARKRAMLADVL